MSDKCCAACSYQMDTDPKCKDSSNNCFDNYGNCADIVKSEIDCQRDQVARGCCATCKKIEENPPAGTGRTDG